MTSLLIQLFVACVGIAPKKSIGVFGAGAGGLTAAWALAYAGYNVTLYERAPLVGGHAYTQPFKTANGNIIPVDLGAQFIAPVRYPNTAELFKLYHIPLVPWSYTFESSLFGDRWSTVPNEWQRTPFWKSIEAEAKKFEDSMSAAYLASMEITVGDWCASLKLSTTFSTEVLGPFLMFIMQTLLSPIHEVASFFVKDLYTFFRPINGWYRPGQGVGLTWEGIAASMLKKLPGNLRIYTNATVTKLSLCNANTGPCSLTVNMKGQLITFQHDYLVSGATRTDLLKILSASTSSPVPIPTSFKSALKETLNSIPTYLHTDSSVFDPQTPKGGTMYEFYNWLFTHNYLQANYSNTTAWTQPLVSYKAVDGAGWAPASGKIQAQAHWTVPVMSSSWVISGMSASRTYNGFGNLWFCGGMIRGDYQESAVITALMVADALGSDFPFRDVPAAARIFDEWSALMQGTKLDAAQITANNLVKNWVKNVRP